MRGHEGHAHESKGLGHQDYKPDEMGTDHAFAYQRLTQTPQVTIVTAETDGHVSLSQMASPTYTRIIIIRYNGIIKEVVPEEYFEFKDSLAKGIYSPITFQWSLQDVDGKSQVEYNQEQVEKIIQQVDGSLEHMVRQWFAPQTITSDQTSTTSATLAVDVNNYKSPLS